MAQNKSSKPTKKKWGKFVFIIVIIALLASIGYGAWAFKTYSDRQNTAEKAVELPGLNLYSVQEFDYNDNNSYYLNYPKQDIATFDNAVKDIAEQAKADFLSQIAQHDNKGDLSVSYDINFYNDQFLSLDLFTYQSVAGLKTESEKAFLYDRQNNKVVSIGDLFKENSDYSATLSRLSRTDLKTMLGNDYNEGLVIQATEPSSSYFDNFTIDDQHNLVIVFEPGKVASIEKGVVLVRISSQDLSGILETPYTDSLFAAAATAVQPTQQRPAPNPNATAPVPQADPSGVNCATAKCIALTFDDGPSYPTPRLLDILKANNVKATFFELGIQVQKYPSLTKRVVSEGHVIGNHTWDHKNLEQMSITDAQGEIGRAADTIQTAGGVRPGLVRAPYGATNQQLAQTLGVTFIQWNIDPNDWKDRNADTVYQRVISAAKPGAIVLSHDIYDTTVDAYERIIPELIRQGYTLVTVPQLLSFGQNVAPGVYFSR